MQFKCPPPPNPLGISEHDRRPKEAMEEERRKKLQDERKLKDEYTLMLMGKIPKEINWNPVHVDHNKYKQIGDNSPHPLFKREPYLDPMLLMSRQMRDDTVFGKPNFHRYLKPLSPSDVNVEFGGIKKPFKVIV